MVKISGLFTEYTMLWIFITGTAALHTELEHKKRATFCISVMTKEQVNYKSKAQKL
jgi:hypothetical protein